MRIAKELQHAARCALAQHWTIMPSGGGHQKWRGPEGQLVIVGSSPHGGRTTINTLNRLRKAGLKL